MAMPANNTDVLRIISKFIDIEWTTTLRGFYKLEPRGDKAHERFILTKTILKPLLFTTIETMKTLFSSIKRSPSTF